MSNEGRIFGLFLLESVQRATSFEATEVTDGSHLRTGSLIETVHLCVVPLQAAGLREGLAAGRAGVRAVAGTGVHVHRQIAGI